MALPTSTIKAWNDGIAEALENVDSVSFPEKMERALRTILDFDIYMIFSYSEFDGVSCLHHNMKSSDADIIVNNYLAGPYLLDPFYAEVTRGRKEGFCALKKLAPDQFYRSEYFRHHYALTEIVDELGLFFPTSSSSTAVLSVARQKHKRHFTQVEQQNFSAAALIVRSLCSMHWDDNSSNKSKARSASSGTRLAIESAFDNFGQDVLSSRESEVVSLVLKGHSSESIGQQLDISAGTVKNHRKNAYEKLGISSQAQLFSIFLNSLKKNLLIRQS